MLSCLQAEINTWVVLSVALPGMTSDPNVMLPAASVGMLLAIGTAGLTVSITVSFSWISCLLSPRQGRLYSIVSVHECHDEKIYPMMLAGMRPHASFSV